MSLGSVKRWQWMVLGLALGWAIAEVRGLAGGGLPDFGGSFNDQKLFETALLREFHGERQFNRLVVYPVRVGGGEERAYVVGGMFYDGNPRFRNGRVEAVWEPRCFVAPTPYQPLADRGKPTDPNSTVLTYLRQVQGVSYTYAWWCDPKWARTAGAAGGLVVIGLVWPTVLNLLLFGRLTRPADEAPVYLPPTPAAATPARPGAAAEAEALERLEADIDRRTEELSADAVNGEKPSGLAVAAAESRPQAPRPLTATAVESADPAPTGPGAEFGAGTDDYYPTVRRPTRNTPSRES